MRKVLIVLTMAAGLLLSACWPVGLLRNAPSAPGQGKDAPLSGTTWLLDRLGGQAVPADARPTLSLDGGKLSGSDGCNQFGGTYSAAGDGRITVNKDIVSTMMACEEPIMQRAAAYMAALTGAHTYRITGQQLALLDASGATLATFTRQSQALAGTSWTVTGYNDGRQAVVSPIAGSQLSLVFDQGQLSGSAGCNGYTAAYEVSGKGLKIAPAASTRKMCAEPASVMEQETQFLRALATAAAYRLDGDRLELRTADGALAVTCTRASTAAAPRTGSALLR